MGCRPYLYFLASELLSVSPRFLSLGFITPPFSLLRQRQLIRAFVGVALSKIRSDAFVEQRKPFRGRITWITMLPGFGTIKRRRKEASPWKRTKGTTLYPSPVATRPLLAVPNQSSARHTSHSLQTRKSHHRPPLLILNRLLA